MVLAEHSKARYKQASTKEMRSPAVVLGSLEPLIPEPVRFPQLFGNRRQYLNALVIRHLRCDPCRDEGTSSSSYKCRFVPSSFLPRLPSWGGGSFLNQLWRRFTLYLCHRCKPWIQNRRLLLTGRSFSFPAPKGNVKGPALESRIFPLRCETSFSIILAIRVFRKAPPLARKKTD